MSARQAHYFGMLLVAIMFALLGINRAISRRDASWTELGALVLTIVAAFYYPA